ncbi:IS21 family transposase [Pseudomonas sp.]|uniref:IS21 family transposase n=1 Tax=Pseudomonas sp. TaxID=306 RepID=UPI003F946206
MNVALWAEIRRLSEIENLSGRAIAQRMHCSRHTVANALNLQQLPTSARTRRQSLLDPYVERIKELLARHPDLSAVRIHEELARQGYAGSAIILRRYLRKIRPARGRVYQEVHYEPGQAMQVDWGECGHVQIGSTSRKVSVFVAVLCYSRLLYIEFTLSQRKAEFYRGLVNALTFFGGSPRAVIFDNLKAAVLNGSGRHACFHPEFLALCGYFCMQPIACARRDPESKGMVEGGVRYVKHNALAGRADELIRFEDYLALAPAWRDQVANVRQHESTRERPIDRFERERALLRPLPTIPFDTDEVVPAVVSPHARIAFDGNRYSAPPPFVRKPLTLRANRDELRLLHEGQVVATHVRSYERGQLVVLPEHRLAALTLRQRPQLRALEQEFDAWGPEARAFHLQLNSRPVKTSVHVRRLLKLAQVYGRTEVLAAISRALALATYDAACVENLLLAERRRRQLPTPTLPTPKRRELIDDIELEPANPAFYDRFCHDSEEDSHATT